MDIKAAIFDMDGTLLWNILWENIGEKYFNNKEIATEYIDSTQTLLKLIF